MKYLSWRKGSRVSEKLGGFSKMSVTLALAAHSTTPNENAESSALMEALSTASKKQVAPQQL